jgi:hypothetical protein
LSGSTNITLGNGTITPIGGQLGVIYTGAVASGTYALAGTPLVSATISNLPAGTYMVSYVIGPNKTTTASTTVSQVIAGFSTTSGGCDYGIFKNSLTQAASTTQGNNFFMNGTDIFTTLVTVNLYLSAGVKATAGTFAIPIASYNKFKAVRIA